MSPYNSWRHTKLAQTHTGSNLQKKHAETTNTCMLAAAAADDDDGGGRGGSKIHRFQLTYALSK